MWHRFVETTCHARQTLAFLAKEKLDIIAKRSPFTFTLRFAASFKKYGPMMPPVHKPHQIMTFSGCNGAFAMLLADLHSKIHNSAYLRVHWAKNELRTWTQFFDKKSRSSTNFPRAHSSKILRFGRSFCFNAHICCILKGFAPKSFRKIFHVVE